MPLTLVPTPIGNLEDITLRALRVLKDADIIACEDTRTSGYLLKRYAVLKPLLSLHDHNEKDRSRQLMQALHDGKKVAVISDAGTPGVSDPGYIILRMALEEGIEVDVLPGPSALLPALMLSGLAPQPFIFCGFPPEKQGQRKKLFQALELQPYTMIFYISPHKAERHILEMLELWGERKAALVREISKIYQEALRGTFSYLTERLAAGLKGEMVLVVEGFCKEEDSDIWQEAAKAMLQEGCSPRSVVEEVVRRYGVPKNEVKAYALTNKALLP